MLLNDGESSYGLCDSVKDQSLSITTFPNSFINIVAVGENGDLLFMSERFQENGRGSKLDR